LVHSVRYGKSPPRALTYGQYTVTLRNVAHWTSRRIWRIRRPGRTGPSTRDALVRATGQAQACAGAHKGRSWYGYGAVMARAPGARSSSSPTPAIRTRRISVPD